MTTRTIAERRGWHVGDTPEEWLDFVMEHGFGDGLPVIPPTPDRVRAFVQAVDRDPQEPLGRVPPRWGRLTVETVAVNAIMAGARPDYLPVILAAMEAMLDPRFGLTTIQVTTNPITPLLMVGGPIASRLGINGGAGYLGPGNRANATIGRTLRLTLINAGGASPGGLDQATGGQPGKYTLAFSENEADAPWEPFRATHGITAGSSVTVMGVVSVVNHCDSTSDGADDLLQNLAQTLTLRGSNSLQMGGQILVLLCPEHAATLASAGMSRRDVQDELFKRATVPVDSLPDSLLRTISWRRGDIPGVVQGGQIRALDDPASALLAVAGGPGKQTVVAFSMRSTEAVTRELP